MKKIALTVVTLGLALNAQADSQFSGVYFGLGAGQNTSSQSATGTTTFPNLKNTYPSLKLGVGKDVGSLLVGAEVFGDMHN